MAARSVAIEISVLPSPEACGNSGGDGGGVVPEPTPEPAEEDADSFLLGPCLSPPEGGAGASSLAILSSSLPLGLAQRPDLRVSGAAMFPRKGSSRE